MNPEPYLVIRRTPYEEPHHLHLHLSASNGTFAGTADMYRNTYEVRETGQALRRFPARVPDEVVSQYGTDDPGSRFYRLVRIRAYTLGRSGRSALQITLDLNEDEPSEGACRFSIQAEPAAINRLGELLVRFAELRHLELRWTLRPDECGLFQEHELYG